MSKLVFITLLVLILCGCQTNKSIYFWGDYADTAYQYKHEPTEESFQEHLATLENIVASAEAKNKKIPPGIYIELAMMYSSINKNEQAKEMLNKEQSLFPESSQFIQLVNQKLLGGAL
ncbi:DUF4810 domain-containing protein (plasmid) [Pseudoalteromonas lipolytica]|jgi:hypothetical protein|uniref:DUF4810 domain-containing protein n=1 Tax=Pseudoalteromonas TaxID=53246 RepID=UPI0018F5402B|nr:DUF4810 domain-containing protein [Pseudoalteromonas sp. bablab_jr011]